MGYFSERLRKRLNGMTKEEKDALWDKLAYLNEIGPVITDYKLYFEYSGDIVVTETSASYPSTFGGDIRYRLAA